MELQVITRSKSRKELIEGATKFYAKQLNISESNYKVVIYTDPDLKSQQVNGIAMRTGAKCIHVALYNRLSMANLLCTLAHEMVHVKQFIRGHYKLAPAKNGKFKKLWLGKQVVAVYSKQPWEIEAYKKQDVLMQQLIDTLLSKIDKKKKK
jgi:hypothetical protein